MKHTFIQFESTYIVMKKTHPKNISKLFPFNTPVNNMGGYITLDKPPFHWLRMYR